MNYRHAFHAGNFADVLKHAVLARLITYLKRKEKPFRIIDTHAGIGAYDLHCEAAERSPEWRDGIGRLLAADLASEAGALLAPYLEVVQQLNPTALAIYPGSPVLARTLMRPQDRLSAIELHPQDHATLAARFAGDRQVRVTHLDGWMALGAHVPPRERRGLILVDPPFEKPGEYQRLVDTFARAHRRFATGVYCLWYPRKAGAPVAEFHAALAASGIPDLLAVELDVRRDAAGSGLTGCGLVIANPPYTLMAELCVLLPALQTVLGQDDGANHALWWLAGEAGRPG